MNNLPDVTDSQLPDNDDESLYERLPHFMQEKVNFLQDNLLFETTDEELEARLFKNSTPDQFCSRLKLSFWDQFEKAVNRDGKIQISKVIAGVCTLSAFKKFIEDRQRLAWLIRMPADYRLALADIHELSLAQMRQIMVMDNYDAKGQPNTKLLDVKVKVAQHVDMRRKGAIIQRIDQRNLNMNVNADANPGKEKDVALSMDEIEKRLEALKRKSTAMLVPGHVRVDLLSEITAEGDTIEVHATKKGSGVS